MGMTSFREQSLRNGAAGPRKGQMLMRFIQRIWHMMPTLGNLCQAVNTNISVSVMPLSA